MDVDCEVNNVSVTQRSENNTNQKVPRVNKNQTTSYDSDNSKWLQNPKEDVGHCLL